MRAVSAVAGLMVLLSAATSAQDTGRAGPSLLKPTFSTLPIYFVENRGIHPAEVAYSISGADKTLFFTKDGITFRLEGRERSWAVKLAFVGANPDVVPRGEDRQPAVVSYFRGPEKDWKTGLRTYARVAYRNLWPGIDLVYRGTVNRLKYEFVVKPGADPGKIRMRYHGAAAVEVTRTGGLRLRTPAGSFEDEPPIAWQEIDGERVPVEAGFVVTESSGEGPFEHVFRVGDYDGTKPLVLDPAVVIYCGFIGGAQYDNAQGVAVDASGNAYVTGITNSSASTFPVRTGPSLTFHGTSAFIAKVNASGTSLVYCGYIGGPNDYARGYAVAVDGAGCAYVVGETGGAQSSFPVKIGPDLTYNGKGDAFVAKVDRTGTALVYCGYVGGANWEWGKGIAVDALGNAYVTGLTDSDQQTFPVKVGPDLTYNSASDAFVARVNSAGTALDYCGYIGGANYDIPEDVAVDAAGNAYVTGWTYSNEMTFPVKVGPDLTFNGQWDAFVAKVNPAGSALDYCGYIGGDYLDEGRGIAVDAYGSAFVAGRTASSEASFPVRTGPDLTFNGGMDAFVAKVNPTGMRLDFCGYIGGASHDEGHAIALDSRGQAFVAGDTESFESSFPVKLGPDLTFNSTAGKPDAFVAKVDKSGGGLEYCGYVGGSGNEWGYGIDVDRVGHAYLVGMTFTTEATFPVKAGPDLTHNGNTDAFVAKVGHVPTVHGVGIPRVGNRVSLGLLAEGSRGLGYQLGTSLATGPIPIDIRRLNLSPDRLFLVTVNNSWPLIFSGYRGVIDSKGQAQAAIHIPSIPALIGVRLHTAFVTLDAAAPSGIRSISSTLTFTITK